MAANWEASEKWFESIGFGDSLVSSSLIVKGPPAKKKKKDEDLKGPLRYPCAWKFYIDLKPSHLQMEIISRGLEYPDVGFVKLEPEL